MVSSASNGSFLSLFTEIVGDLVAVCDWEGGACMIFDNEPTMQRITYSLVDRVLMAVLSIPDCISIHRLLSSTDLLTPSPCLDQSNSDVIFQVLAICQNTKGIFKPKFQHIFELS